MRRQEVVFHEGDVVKVNRTDSKWYGQIGFIKEIRGSEVLVRMGGFDLTFSESELDFVKSSRKHWS